MQTQSNRRDFLKKSCAIGAGVSFIPAYLTSARADDNPKLPPSQRINLAAVGVGNRGAAVLGGIGGAKHVEPIALCDIDFSVKNADKSKKRFPKAKLYGDFRVMFDEMANDFDAVCVVTPDHTHFPITMMAMAHGKHVYTEKPLTHTFEEAEILMKAEKKFNVVTQMGNQGHTSDGFNTYKHMVDTNIIKNVNKIEAWVGAGLWFLQPENRTTGLPPKGELPEGLNWDLWCGPRELGYYSSKYHPYDWRAFYEYGGGMLGDWGAHVIDFQIDTLNLGLPTKLSAIKMEDHDETVFPLKTHLSMTFPANEKNNSEVELIWKDGVDSQPKSIDEKFCDKDSNGKLKKPKLGHAGSITYSDNGEMATFRGHHGDIPRPIPRDQFKKHYQAMKEAPKNHQSHARSFADACMGKGKTNSPFSVGGTLTQVLSLGTICQQLNTDLEFDRTTKKFIGNDLANELLAPPTRKGWESYYKMV